jgi:hypothetical protein
MEGYTTEEVVKCCADYIKDGKWIGLPIPLHEGRLGRKGRMGQKNFVNKDYSLVRHISVYYSISRLMSRPSTNTCQICEEITQTAQMPGS